MFLVLAKKTRGKLVFITSKDYNLKIPLQICNAVLVSLIKGWTLYQCNNDLFKTKAKTSAFNYKWGSTSRSNLSTVCTKTSQQTRIQKTTGQTMMKHQ